MHTILVVDDDDRVRHLLGRLLIQLGHHVLEAASASDALDVLDREAVDLALVDVLMPGRDGVWLTEQILARHPGVPVALVTGLLEMDPTVTLRPGVVGYLVKPFTRHDIERLLDEAFAAPAAARTEAIDLATFDAM